MLIRSFFIVSEAALKQQQSASMRREKKAFHDCLERKEQDNPIPTRVEAGVRPPRLLPPFRSSDALTRNGPFFKKCFV